MSKWGERKNIIDDINGLIAKIMAAKFGHKGHKIKLYMSSVEKEKKKDVHKITDLLHSVLKKAALWCGDFWITLNGKILFLFEKKTFHDFTASLTDGRWASQKLKMKEMPISCYRTFWLFEDPLVLSDDMNKKECRYIADRSVIVGAMVNIIGNQKRIPLRTMNNYETAYFLLKFMLYAYTFADTLDKKLAKYPKVKPNYNPRSAKAVIIDDSNNGSGSGEGNNSIDSIDTSDNVHENNENNANANDDTIFDADDIEDAENSDNDDDNHGADGDDGASASIGLTKHQEKFAKLKTKGVANPVCPKGWYLKNLRDIPRMGQMSKAVIKRFPRWKCLVDFLENPEMSKKSIIDSLANISLNSSDMLKEIKKTNNRKLGKVLAARLYEFVTQCANASSANSTDSVNAKNKSNVYNMSNVEPPEDENEKPKGKKRKVGASTSKSSKGGKGGKKKKNTSIENNENNEPDSDFD